MGFKFFWKFIFSSSCWKFFIYIREPVRAVVLHFIDLVKESHDELGVYSDIMEPSESSEETISFEMSEMKSFSILWGSGLFGMVLLLAINFQSFLLRVILLPLVGFPTFAYFTFSFL